MNTNYSSNLSSYSSRYSSDFHMHNMMKKLKLLDRGDGVSAELLQSALKLSRRTTNRYLQALARTGQVRRSGWNWFLVD